MASRLPPRAAADLVEWFQGMTPPQLFQGVLTREKTTEQILALSAVPLRCWSTIARSTNTFYCAACSAATRAERGVNGNHTEKRGNGDERRRQRHAAVRRASRSDAAWADRIEKMNTPAVALCSFSRSDPPTHVGRPRRPTRRTGVFSVRPSMFRAAVKLIAINECSSVLAAEQTAHPIGGPRRRPTLTRISARATRAGVHACRRCPSSSSRASGCASWVCAPSPRLLSEHARLSRGPLRLCSLNPDTSAAVPVSVSVARARPGRTPYRAARVRRVSDRLRGFQHRTRGNHAGGRIPPQRDQQLPRERHNADPTRPFARARSASDTTASARCAVATAPSSTRAESW